MTDEEKKDPATADATADKETVEKTTKALAEETKAPEVEEIKAEEAKVEEPKKEEPKKETKTVPAKFKELVEIIEKLTVIELADLVKILEDKFGVSAAAPVTMVAGGAQPSGATEPVEEKTAYDVVLASAGVQKIAVIKAVREIKPDLGLKEAKDLVDAAPKDILKGAKKEDAEAAKAKLEAAGATVEMK